MRTLAGVVSFSMTLHAAFAIACPVDVAPCERAAALDDAVIDAQINRLILGSLVFQSDYDSLVGLTRKAVGEELTGSISSLASDSAEADFAFPNWIRLQDHEGDSFTALSASELTVSNGDYTVETSTPVVGEEAVLRVLVDDEGVPLFPAVAGAFAEPEITGGVSNTVNTAIAVEGFEDR